MYSRKTGVTVRSKIIGSAALVFLVTVAVTVAATVTLVQAEYIKIEAENVKKDTHRAVDAVNNQVNELALKIPDWSSWDDTYQFIQDHNRAFVVSNLQNEALQSLSMNTILFYNSSQELVMAKSIDTQTGDDMPVAPELLAALGPGSPLLAHSDTDGHQGLLATATDPLLMVTRPILRTDGTGPVRGTLVFAQYLSDATVAKLGSLTHLQLAYLPAHDAHGKLTSQAASCPTPTVACTQTHDNRTVVGLQLINDLYNRPLLLAQVTEPRSIYQETQRTLVLYLAIILGAGLASLVTAFITVNLIVRKDRIISLKNEFFSIASHELRTPLTAIRGNSVLLLQHYGPKNDADFTAATADIHEASVRLIKIVNDFLDLARLERGQMPVTLAPVALAQPVEVVIKELQSVAAEKGLYVKAELPAKLPLAYADNERIQQIIYNLAGNAMKFTTQGGVTIKAEARGRELAILIEDTGRGMTPAEQKKLFKSFQQTRDQDATIGSGLGLYISKLLVERMGGHIWVEESAIGRGTTLAFSVPRAAPAGGSGPSTTSKG